MKIAAFFRVLIFGAFWGIWPLHLNASESKEVHSSELSQKADRAVEASADLAQEAWKLTRQKSQEAWSVAKTKVSKAIDSMDKATVDERAVFQAKMNDYAQAASLKINEWKAGAKQLTPELRQKLDEALRDFKERANNMGDAGAEKWEEAKISVKSSWGKLQAALDEAEDQETQTSY